MSDLPQVTPDFLEENQRLCQTMPNLRKGGPYTKDEQEKRRAEVYRLHFEYGHSARKISEMMRINRNTINGDITHWYSKVMSSHNVLDPADAIILGLQRLEIQYTRLRESLDNTESFAEKLAVERLMCDIDSKIIHVRHRLAESTKRMIDLSTIQINKFMEKNGKDTRYMTLLDKISVSEKALKRIDKIIKNDKIKSVM